MQINIVDTTRINERIRADVVRLIGPDGEQVGIVNLREALDYADRLNLDLVEVAPMANPPVCKVMHYEANTSTSRNKKQRSAQAANHQHQGDQASPQDR